MSGFFVDVKGRGVPSCLHMDSYTGTVLSVLQSLEARLSALENDKKRAGVATGDPYEELVGVIKEYRRRLLAGHTFTYNMAFSIHDRNIDLIKNPHDDDPSIAVTPSLFLLYHI